MAIKKRILRRPGQGSAVTPSPELLSLLAEPGSVELTVRMMMRVGSPIFEGLDDENDEDVRRGVDILRELWPRHSVAAVDYCIRHHGAGKRPHFWWTDKPRPFVKPRDWNDPADATRFEKERAAADLAFLEKHKLLTREELRILAEEKQPKSFGP